MNNFLLTYKTTNIKTEASMYFVLISVQVFFFDSERKGGGGLGVGGGEGKGDVRWGFLVSVSSPPTQSHPSPGLFQTFRLWRISCVSQKPGWNETETRRVWEFSGPFSWKLKEIKTIFGTDEMWHLARMRAFTLDPAITCWFFSLRAFFAFVLHNWSVWNGVPSS